MKKQSLLALVMCLAVSVPLAMAQDAPPAQPGGDGPPSREGRKHKRMKHRHGKMHGQGYNLRAIKTLPSLTEEQKGKLDSIQEELKTNLGPLKSELKALRAQRKAGEGGTPEEVQANKEAGKAKFLSLRNDLQAKKKAAYDQALAVLSDEQKVELEAHKAQLKQGMMNKRMNRKGKLNEGGRRLKRKNKKAQGENLEQASESLAPQQ